MKKFLLRLSFFIVPVLLYLSVPTYVLYRSGENFYNPDALISSGEKHLIGYAYNESNYLYLKWKTAATQKHKTVMALGSSRVLQFRENMFTADFYNAGYTVSGLRDFETFLNSIPQEKLPKYLIINLDQWMFNPKWDNFAGKIKKNRWANSFSKNPNLSTLNNVWKDLYAGKYGLNIPSKDYTVGLNAIVNQKGFRNDGSMKYGKQISELLTDTTGHYNDTYNRIKLGNRRFEYSDHINPDAASELENLLQFCRKNDIKLIAFLPPFGDAVYQKMIASGKYAYLNEIMPEISPLFKKHGFELYDFSSVSACGSNDNETIDGFHGGEVTTQKMLVKMLESGSVLTDVTNVAQLNSDLKKALNRYQVYP